MAVSTAKETSFAPDLELDEYYTAKIVSGDEVDSQYEGIRVNLVLRLLDPDTLKPLKNDDGEFTDIFNYVTVGPNSGKKSKLYQIWSGMFYGGKEVPEGTDMNTDELVGMNCRFFWGMLPPAKNAPERPGVVRMSALKTRAGTSDGAAAKTKAMADAIDGA